MFEICDTCKAFITSVFAPTTLHITFETEGIGKFSPEDIERVVIRDKKTGNAVGLDLPKKMVIVSNHQVSVNLSVCLFLLTNAFSCRCMPTGGIYGLYCTSWTYTRTS